MNADINLTIFEDSEGWIVRNPDFEISGSTLPELDKNLKNALIRSGKYSKGTELKIFMGCDLHIIPEWMRPYQSHYFNRIVTFKL